MSSLNIEQKEEFWIVRRIIGVTQKDVEDILNITHEIYKAIDNHSNVKSKHYFWEDDGFHLRIEVDSKENVSKLEIIIGEILSQSRFKDVIDSFPYVGEWNDWDWHLPDSTIRKCDGYGVVWLEVKKIYDSSCRIRIYKKYYPDKLKNYSKDENLKNFNWKLVHCILNHQFDGNGSKEKEFHCEFCKVFIKSKWMKPKDIINDILKEIHNATSLDEVKKILNEKYDIVFTDKK